MNLLHFFREFFSTDAAGSGVEAAPPPTFWVKIEMLGYLAVDRKAEFYEAVKIALLVLWTKEQAVQLADVMQPTTTAAVKTIWPKLSAELATKADPKILKAFEETLNKL